MTKSVKNIAPPWLTFYRAEDWGIEWKRPPVEEGLADAETYIHHGAGGRYGTDPQQAMRTLQTWYHDVKNYSTIAYDVMVHRNTDDESIAVLGAREGWLSAATKDRNDIGEAICLWGYFHPGHRLSEHPTEREIEGLAFAVAWSIEMGWSALDTNVLGHRDNPAHPGATGCPGDYLYPHVAAIGERALELLALANQPPKDDMTPLDIPERIFDSRDTYEFRADETRTIPVGSNQAFLHVTLLSSTPGYVSVSGSDIRSYASLVNADVQGGIATGGAPIMLPDGSVRVYAMSGGHVIIDVYARG